MKKTSVKVSEDLRPEYNLDYSKAKPNRFAGRIVDRVVVVLDPDISEELSPLSTISNFIRSSVSALCLLPVARSR